MMSTDALLAWLRRWRPCVPPPTLDGRTIEEWADAHSLQTVEIAGLKGTVQDRDKTIDTLVLRVEQLADLVRDIRQLSGREGV